MAGTSDGTLKSVAKSFSKDVVLNNESKLDLSVIPKLKRRIKGTPKQSKRNCTEKSALTNNTSNTFTESIEEGEKIVFGSSSFESFSTDLQCYMELLLLYKGFTPIGDFFDYFVLRDYDIQARQLEANTFLFVRRRSICFKESAFHWCFTCEYNTTRTSLINGLSGSVDISFEGICYGYELMDSHESPNVPFTLLLTRFKKAPSTVIYDNSCKLHAYCLNRYPDFFRGTWFLVDRLHWFNHRGCNGGYNLNEYAQFNSLNSQAAEQCNSSLGKLKSMLSYMTNKNFHLHCKFYLWVLNLRKQLKA